MSRLAPAYAGALLALAVHLVWSHFAGALGSGLGATALLALIALTCTGIGRLVLKAFIGTELSQSEGTLLGCTLGLGILSQLVFLLAALGALSVWSALALLSGLWVLSFTEMREVVVSLAPDRSLLGERPAWTAAIAALLAAGFWSAWVPPHQYDALVYHLELPALYVRHGGLVIPEGTVYGHFPQNGEMLFTLALLLRSDLLAQLFSWLAGALSVWWLFELGRREAPLTAALLACALLASHTAFMLLGACAYVETFVMLWVTAAVFCWLRWRELAGRSPAVPALAGAIGAAGLAGTGEGPPRRWLALSAVYCGLAFGAKYVGGVAPAILLLFLLARRSGPKDLVVFAGTAALVASPWLLKNLVATGNPVYPFLYQHLPYWGPGPGVEMAQRYFAFLREYSPAAGDALKNLAQFPYLAAIGSQRFGGGADVLGDLGWAPIMALLPAAGVAAVRNRAMRRLSVYCLLHAAVWYSTAVVLRFLVVLVPLFCLPAAWALHGLWLEMGRWGRALLGAALGLFLALNLGLFLHVQSLLASWEVLLGAQTRDEYLSRRLDYYPCAQWARDHLGRNDRILLVGESRGYHLAQDHVATSAMAPNDFVAWADAASGPAGLATRLREEGRFTHLLVVPRELRRIAGYGTMDFTPEGRANWEGLGSAEARPVFRGPACGLLVLRPSHSRADAAR